MVLNFSRSWSYYYKSLNKLSTSGFVPDQDVLSFKKMEKWERTLEDKKKVTSKNELWDKFKGVRVIMEIRMKSISDCFQDWKFTAQILYEVLGWQLGEVRIRSTEGIKWKVEGRSLLQ